MAGQDGLMAAQEKYLAANVHSFQIDNVQMLELP